MSGSVRGERCIERWRDSKSMALPLRRENKIQAEGKDAGEITSVATVAVNGGEKLIALGVLRKEYLGGEKELTAGGAKLCIASIPFAGIFGS